MSQTRDLDFSHQDLRNSSFKNLDFTEANFCGCDIRGCDFNGATLTKANFEQVRAGQSHQQLLVKITGAFAFAVAFVSTGAGAFAIVSASAFAVVSTFVFAGAFAIVSALVFANAVALTFVIAGAGADVFSSVFGGAFLGAIIGAVAGAGTDAAFSAFSEGSTLEGVLLSLGAVLLFGSAIYTIFQQVKAIKNATGTSFRNANLTGARFNYAVIHNTDFSGAVIDQVDWTRFRFFKTFPIAEVIKLHTSRNGKDEDYRNADLANNYLVGVDLARANLSSANLNGANLQQAILERVNLTEAQALKTDFTDAVLTGVCIKNWGINAETIFTNVRCDYVYLELGEQERRPSSGTFQSGDFEKLVGHFTNKTLDFLFHNGIEPQAFDYAMRKLLENYGDMGISINSLVNLGDGDRLVRFDLSNPNANKFVAHQRFVKDYESMQKQLQDAREKMDSLQQQLAHAEGQLIVYKEQSTYLRAFTYHQTDRFSRPGIYVHHAQFPGDLMPDNSSKIQFGNVQGDVSGVAGGDISGVAGKDQTGVAGRDISGTVTNTIGQLEASPEPEALQLADLLKQLQTAITREDSELSQKDQEKALKYIDILGKLGNDRQNPDLLEKAEAALDALPTIAKRGAGLIEFAEKHLPTITSAVRAILGL